MLSRIFDGKMIKKVLSESSKAEWLIPFSLALQRTTMTAGGSGSKCTSHHSR